MHNITKATLILFAASPLSFSQPAPLLAESRRIDLDFGNRTMSADIEEAPVKAVIEKIKEERGIWVKGSHHLTDQRFSVDFEDLPVQDGLERILSRMNHSLLFDQYGKLLGVIILGTSDRKWSRGRRRSVAPRRVPRRYRRR